jgi:hypothetical protein
MLSLIIRQHGVVLCSVALSENDYADHNRFSGICSELERDLRGTDTLKSGYYDIFVLRAGISLETFLRESDQRRISWESHPYFVDQDIEIC